MHCCADADADAERFEWVVKLALHLHSCLGNKIAKETWKTAKHKQFQVINTRFGFTLDVVQFLCFGYTFRVMDARVFYTITCKWRKMLLNETNQIILHKLTLAPYKRYNFKGIWWSASKQRACKSFSVSLRYARLRGKRLLFYSLRLYW